MRKEIVDAINLEIINENGGKKDDIVFNKTIEFQELINWVWRNCQGAHTMEIKPNISVSAQFDDRVELYTIHQVEREG